MRSSCRASQLLMLTNRSELPATPEAELDAKSESPMTATRVCGLPGGSPAVFAAAGASGASWLSVRPIVMGPLWSPAFSSSDTLPPPDSSDLMSASDQLLSLVFKRSCDTWLGFAPACPLTDCASGYAVIIVNPS